MYEHWSEMLSVQQHWALEFDWDCENIAAHFLGEKTQGCDFALLGQWLSDLSFLYAFKEIFHANSLSCKADKLSIHVTEMCSN